MDTKVSWFVCICSSLANVIINGCLYTYSILFPKILEEFQEGKAKTAMVASISMAMYMVLCPVTAKLSLRFGSRIIIVVGGLTCALGFLGSSFAPNLYVLYLSFGVMVGVGSSLVIMAAFQIIPLYFEKHRDFAAGVVSVGPGAGILVMTPVIQTLLDHFDWRKTMLVLAAINLLPSILGCSIKRKKNSAPPLRPNNPSNSRCCRILQVFDFTLFKDPGFVILVMSGVLTILGCTIPTVHLVKHALEVGVPGHLSSWVVFAFGPASMVARILAAKLCNTGWVPYLRIYQFAVILLALDTFLAPLATTFTSLMVYSVVSGISYGMHASPLICMVLNWYGASGLGWVFFCQGFGFFTSPVLAGWISDVTGSYHPAFYTAGGILFMSLCLSQLTKCFKRKNTGENLESMEEGELVIFQKETVV